MQKKYKLTDETIVFNGHTLHRIQAIKSFGNVHKCNIGGWIESEKNLSHDGNCWVADNSKIFDRAYVYDDAQVFDNAIVCGDAQVYDNAKVYNNAFIEDYAMIYGNAKVYGEALVYDIAMVNYEVFDNEEIDK